MSKKQLTRTLAEQAGVTPKQAAAFLEKLTQLALAETVASGEFTLPGLCKLKRVRRQPRQVRNPATGQRLLLGERDDLKIVALKNARNHVSPPGKFTVTVLRDEAESIPAAPAGPADAGTRAEPELVTVDCIHCAAVLEVSAHLADQPITCPNCGKTFIAEGQSTVGQESEFIYFRCKTCSQEIESYTNMAGIESHCPACGTRFTIPSKSEIAVEQPEATGESAETREAMRKAMLGRTMRIELPSDLMDDA